MKTGTEGIPSRGLTGHARTDTRKFVAHALCAMKYTAAPYDTVNCSMPNNDEPICIFLFLYQPFRNPVRFLHSNFYIKSKSTKDN